MQIKIAERLRPFCHQPGSCALLPGSSFAITVYPTLLEVYSIQNPIPEIKCTLKLHLEGPFEDFTFMQDLEKGCIKVWGHSKQGYVRYRLHATQEGIAFFMEKAPTNGVGIEITSQLSQSSDFKQVQSGDQFLIDEGNANNIQLATLERLSLGYNKAQDWQLISRRQDIAEVLPFWHRLGQMVSPADDSPNGTGTLLTKCQDVIAHGSPEKVMAEFRNLFLAGFEGMLVPRLNDSSYQGIVQSTPNEELKGSSLTLLHQGYHLIRSLFIQQKNGELFLLPKLPPELHCGRLLDAQCANVGKVSIEWTKKSLRRVIIVPQRDLSLSFHFSQGEKRCRVRTSYKDRGMEYQVGMPLDLIAGKNYWFDNFQR